ncbi:hypothetical protein HLH33_13835 [Gluconacetobacter diazotrophicus]|uniref:Uncharacterized protein n=1 Tax=Gluconacetobacter diazotrophicus TaxID=33996 RepID=A0A7W4NN30_GLUDI|nr:hypothetical protein [Gluconacetobacter diazotrophicus]MBB2157380.1 hypothetical protein [Gluconacetobacter diazotrophicus]
MDLGLSTLTDDQLVELVRAIAAEMAQRNPSVLDAAKRAMMDVVAQARQSQDMTWSIKKWLGKMMVDHLGEGWNINVWNARDRDEARVYLEHAGTDRHGRDAMKYCYYVTGGEKFPPGSLSLANGIANKTVDTAIVKIVAKSAFERFPTGVSIDCDLAARTEYATPPEPAELTEYAEKLALRARYEADRDAERVRIWAEELESVRAEIAAIAAQRGKRIWGPYPTVNDLGTADPDYARLKQDMDAATEAARGRLDLWDAEHPEPK